jgi:hypothetical protein
VKHHHPTNYSVPAHAAKIAATADFKKVAAGLGVRAEDLYVTVADELQKIVADQRAQELADYEQELGVRAIAAAVEKAKAKQAA